MSDIVERLLAGTLTQPGNISPTCVDVDAADVLMVEAANEIMRLDQLLSEADKRERDARAKALEEAAKACVSEDRHGPWQRTNAGLHFARVIRALESEVR